jgi:NADH-quinone oxidoreductase subunit C
MDAKAIHEKLAARFGDKLTAANLEAASPFAVVATHAIAEVAAFCKAEPELALDNLACLSGVDYPKDAPPRMEVVYHLFSYAHLHSFALKVQLAR